MANPPAIEHGKYYHIFNQGNNRENIFFSEKNYYFFMMKYEECVSSIADTFSFSLLQNHFHFFIRIKEIEEIPEILRKRKPGNIIGDFFSAYARAFNITYDRKGSLFRNPFGRKEVIREEYVRNLIVYIHQNPERHGFVTDFRDWSFSSYQALTTSNPTFLERNEVINWFGSLENFSKAHNNRTHFEELNY